MELPIALRVAYAISGAPWSSAYGDLSAIMFSASRSFRAPRACATVILGYGTNNLERLCTDWIGAGTATAAAPESVMRGEATMLRG